ncbi:MAG: Rossmann-like domain-containing protein [Caldimicrobium sp.]
MSFIKRGVKVVDSLYKELVERAISLGRGERVKRAVIGLFYAFSEIEKGGAGLAYIDKDMISSCCEASSVTFWKEPADLLVKYYLQGSIVESFLAFSLINALINNSKELTKYPHFGDPFQEIALNNEDKVLMIGYFEPLFKKLSGKVKSIIVIEKEERSGLEKLLHNEMDKIKIALVTSATLANKTFHTYLSILKEISEVILMGPSTPLCPEIFKYTPVTWLCGVKVKDTELLFRLVCEGKGTPDFFRKGAIEKINIKVQEK